MKRFGREYRLQADSDLSVTREFDHAMADVGDLRFGGRKVRPGAMINALCLWFSTLSLQERRRFSAEILGSLELFMEGEDAPASVGMPRSERDSSASQGTAHATEADARTGDPVRRRETKGRKSG